MSLVILGLGNRNCSTIRVRTAAVAGLAVFVSAARALAAEPQSELDRVAVGLSIESAQMPLDVASAYRTVFRTNDDEAMARLLGHECHSISLKAAWRLTELKCTERPDKDPLVRFTGFVEGRTKATLPRWWEACVLDASLDMSHPRKLRTAGWTDVDADLFPIHHTELPDGLLTVPLGVDVEYEGEWMVWKTEDTTTRIPLRIVRTEKTRGHGDWATILTEGTQTYLAVGSDYGGSFGLLCLDADGKEIWRSSGWGNGKLRGGASGFWLSACEMVCDREQLVVFGWAFSGLFLEAFDRKSGKPLYRFSTRYIEETDTDHGAREGSNAPGGNQDAENAENEPENGSELFNGSEGM